MLNLDETKIRKGKALGLPYVGSKKKISKKIVEIIKQNFGCDQPIYDVFGGGGAITAECLINGLDVHYNDLDSDITQAFMRVISQDREWVKTLIVSREEFFRIKNKENRSTDDFLKLLVNSFGNNGKDYLYSKKFSEAKYNLAQSIIKNEDVFSGYKQTETYKAAVDGNLAAYEFENNSERHRALKRLQQLEQLRQLERLEQLQQLERIQQLGQLEQLESTNEDYTAFSNLKNKIIYLDPPYESAKQEPYKGNTFDSLALYDWAYNMSKNNIVLLSSYTVSDNRFEAAYEFKKATSNYVGRKSNKRYEKLFMAKK